MKIRNIVIYASMAGVIYAQSPSPSSTPATVESLDALQQSTREWALQSKMIPKDGSVNYYSVTRATTSGDALLAHIRFEEGVMDFVNDKLDAAEVKWTEADKLLRGLPKDSADAAYLRRVNAARAHLWMLQLLATPINSRNFSRIKEFASAINSHSLPKDDVIPVHQLQTEYAIISTERILDVMDKIKQTPDEKARLNLVQQALAANWDDRNLNDQLIKSEAISGTSHEALVDRLVFEKKSNETFPLFLQMGKNSIPSMQPDTQPFLMGMLVGWSLDGDTAKYTTSVMENYPTPDLKASYAKTLLVVIDTLNHYPKGQHLLAEGVRLVTSDSWPDATAAIKAANLLADEEQFKEAIAIINTLWPAETARPPEASLIMLKCAALMGNMPETKKLSALPSLPPEALYWSGVGATKSGNYKAAIVDFDKFSDNPGSSLNVPKAMFQAALNCLNTSQQEKAKERFTVIAQKYPESALGKKAQEFLSRLQTTENMP